MTSRVWSAANSVLLVVVCGVLLMLSHSSMALRERVRELRRRNVLLYEGLLLPTVTAQSTAGSAITVGEQRSGGVQLLVFLGTTCRFSLASLPELRRLSDSLALMPGVEIIGLSPDSLPLTRDFLAKQPLPFPLATLGPKEAALFRVRAFPTVTLLDSAGVIRFVRFGTLEAAEATDSILQHVRAFLSQQGWQRQPA